MLFWDFLRFFFLVVSKLGMFFGVATGLGAVGEQLHSVSVTYFGRQARRAVGGYRGWNSGVDPVGVDVDRGRRFLVTQFEGVGFYPGAYSRYYRRASSFFVNRGLVRNDFFGV